MFIKLYRRWYNIGYKNVQHYRHTVHRYLDGIWLASCKKRQARTLMYKILSIKMNIDFNETHVKYFNREQCRQAIRILRPMYIQLYGKDIEYKRKEKKKMAKVRITRHEEFETAHLLPGHEKGCGRLHGHTYKIEVTVEGPQKEPWGMVMDFGDLKKAIKESTPDHKFVYCTEGDQLSADISKVLVQHNIDHLAMPFMTTAENMVGYYAQCIDDYIKNELGYKDVDVVEVKLWETTNSYATWIK